MSSPEICRKIFVSLNFFLFLIIHASELNVTCMILIMADISNETRKLSMLICASIFSSRYESCPLLLNEVMHMLSHDYPCEYHISSLFGFCLISRSDPSVKIHLDKLLC